MSVELAKLAYENGLRSLDKQEKLVEEIRTRTGLVIAASALAATFLGAPVLERAHAFLLAGALCAFASSLGASLAVLRPPRGLFFSVAGRGIYIELFEFRDEPAELYRRLAYDLQRCWDANDVRVTTTLRWYRAAIIGLAVEIVLLLAALTDILLRR